MLITQTLIRIKLILTSIFLYHKIYTSFLFIYRILIHCTYVKELEVYIKIYKRAFKETHSESNCGVRNFVFFSNSIPLSIKI